MHRPRLISTPETRDLREFMPCGILQTRRSAEPRPRTNKGRTPYPARAKCELRTRTQPRTKERSRLADEMADGSLALLPFILGRFQNGFLLLLPASSQVTSSLESLVSNLVSTFHLLSASCCPLCCQNLTIRS